MSESFLDRPSRPTLPSIHDLDLPTSVTGRSAIHKKYEFDEHPNRTSNGPGLPRQLILPQQHPRRASNFSLTSSRTSSPSPSIQSFSPSENVSSTKFRLVPTSLDAADAVILVPPTSPTKQGQPRKPTLLLVGGAVQSLKQSRMRIANGTRLHPYRIVRGSKHPPRPRPSSTASA